MVIAIATMIILRMTASDPWVTRLLTGAQRPGQQAPPHRKYPAGQAEADVTTHVVAHTATSSPTILIMRMTVS